MGQPTEQSIQIIEATADAIAKVQPEPEPTNYWWMLAIAIVPVVIGLLWRRK